MVSNNRIFQSYYNYNNNIGNKFPDEYILSRGSFSIINQNEWVFARFSPHPNQEHFFAMGAEDGTIGLCDTTCSFDQKNFIKKVIKSGNSVIFDFCYLPGIENCLVSLSGDSKLYFLDIETGTSIAMFGHSNSVRCASIWLYNPFCLVTGARDGSILCWDLRTSPTERFAKEDALLCINPYRTYSDAHEVNHFSTSNARKIPLRSSFPITGLLHLGEHYIISASTLASSGIRIWDLRYQIASTPIRRLTIPQKMTKESGISCLSWDRFHSSFFAACTDNSIYEYMPSVNTDLPVRTLNGQNINSFFTQCSASPVSDHLICGSSYRQAFIWDLQETKKYKTNLCHAYRMDFSSLSEYNYLPEPKFALEGHENEVECVQWSHQGNYLLTIGQNCLRIWSSWASKDEKGYPDQILVEHRPFKLRYPTLRQKKQIDVLMLIGNTTMNHKNDEIQIITSCKKKKFIESPGMLHNLPAIYFKHHGMAPLLQQYELKTPHKITIKENINMTPAFKIPRAEGHENLPSISTPRSTRNLTIEFQRQKTRTDSNRKRKSMPYSITRKRQNQASKSKRILYQTNTPIKANQSELEKSQSILKYFSPIAKVSPGSSSTMQ